MDNETLTGTQTEDTIASTSNDEATSGGDDTATGGDADGAATNPETTETVEAAAV